MGGGVVRGIYETKTQFHVSSMDLKFKGPSGGLRRQSASGGDLSRGAIPF